MFFETLILGTRNCIKLEQTGAYGDFEIHARPKLWEVCENLNKLNVQEHREATRDLDVEEEDAETPTRGQRSSAQKMQALSSKTNGSQQDTPTASAKSKRSVQMSI